MNGWWHAEITLEHLVLQFIYQRVEEGRSKLNPCPGACVVRKAGDELEIHVKEFVRTHDVHFAVFVPKLLFELGDPGANLLDS